MSKIQAFVKKYPAEWLTIEVARESEGGPSEGELIYHSAGREDVWEKTKSSKKLYIAYAGPPLKERYAAAC